MPGPRPGGEPTYVLMDDWVPARGETADRQVAAAALALRYFTSHGPATFQDFTWWSGLPAGEAQGALESAKDRLIQEAAGRTVWWMAPQIPLGAHGASAPAQAHLLPPFDGYLLGYRDRSASLSPGEAREFGLGGGLPKPCLIVAGRAAGTWRRAAAGEGLEVTVQPFGPLSRTAEELVAAAARSFGSFLEKPVVLRYGTRS